MTTSETDYVGDLQDRIRELERKLEACEAERSAFEITERRHRLLIEECPSGVVVLCDEKIVYANKAAVQLAGATSAAELNGRSIWTFVEEDRQQHFRSILRKVLAEGDHVDFIVQNLKRLDRHRIAVEVIAMPGTFEGRAATIATISDISVRIESEVERHSRQSAITQAQRWATIGEMSMDIMHEINNPLTAIKLYSQAAMNAFEAPADASKKLRECLHHIHEQSDRAADIMKRMRTFTRVSRPVLSPVSMNELIRQVIPLLEIDANRFQTTLRYNLTELDPEVRVERLLIGQVLINLVRNGVESMAGNSIENRTLVISTSFVNSEVQTSVGDQGVGLSEAETDRVFDRFFTKKPNGVGLGLAISKMIVESHGGRIWVARNDERGVTFHFSLPVSSS